MRTSLRLLLAGALVTAAMPVMAAVPVFGLAATPGCAGVLDNDLENAELIGVKIAAGGPPGGVCTDIMFDLTQTGGRSTAGATTGNAVNSQWNIPPNWKVTQAPTDGHFVYLIYPPAPGTKANRMMVDSGTIVNQDFTAAAIQTVGNSVPKDYNDPALGGTHAGSTSHGIDLNLSSAGTYSVKLQGTGPAATAGFPRGANGGVEVAFAPLAEVNTADLVGGGCSVGGETRNPNSPNDPQVDGAIIGYNVYRLTGTAGTPPTAQNFYDASINADPTDGWQYFMPLTQSYNLGLPDTTAGPGTPAASDTNPNDLGGLQNPDGVMYSGDEVMIYQDSGTNRGVPRVGGSAPAVGTGYWYAFQPVMCGSVDDYTAAIGFDATNDFLGMHGMNLSALAGGNDAVDLDLDGKADFFSPQHDVNAQPGLGFAYNGLPVLSEPVFGQVNPAAAHGSVTLSGHVDGGNVDITFQTGLEAGEVQGFNVYRGVGDTRVRVNGQPILAQGTESSVYQLVDDAVQARRLSKGGVVQYTVEIVYTDGHTSMVGPFAVTIDRQAPARRSR